MLASNSATFQQIRFLTGDNQANKLFWLFVSFVLFCSTFFSEPQTNVITTTGIASNAENFVSIASPRKTPTATYSTESLVVRVPAVSSFSLTPRFRGVCERSRLRLKRFNTFRKNFHPPAPS